MKEYVFSLIAVSLFGGIACAIAPGGKMKKSISFIVSLLLITAVGRPIIKLFKDAEIFSYTGIVENLISEEKDYDGVFNGEITYIAKESAKAYAENILTEELCIDESDFRIEAVTNTAGGEIELERIDVTLIGKGLLVNPRTVEKKIRESFGCICNVYEEWSDKNGDGGFD